MQSLVALGLFGKHHRYKLICGMYNIFCAAFIVNLQQRTASGSQPRGKGRDCTYICVTHRPICYMRRCAVLWSCACASWCALHARATKSSSVPSDSHLVCIISCDMQLKAAQLKAAHIAKCDAATGLQNSYRSWHPLNSHKGLQCSLTQCDKLTAAQQVARAHQQLNVLLNNSADMGLQY